MADVDAWIAEVESRMAVADRGPWLAVEFCGEWRIKAPGGEAIVEHAPFLTPENAEAMAHGRTDLPRALRLLKKYREAFKKIGESEPDEASDGSLFGSLVHDEYEMAEIAATALAETGEAEG